VAENIPLRSWRLGVKNMSCKDHRDRKEEKRDILSLFILISSCFAKRIPPQITQILKD